MNPIINTVPDLIELAKRIKAVTEPIAVDTETNGLFPVEDKIIGWSLAFSETEGYYIPRNHRYSENVPDAQIKQLFELLMQKLLIWHNGKFDIEFIKTNFGLEMPVYSDTMVMAYLACFKKLALKEIMSDLFHYDTVEFKELLAKKYGPKWKTLGYTAADLKAEDISDYAIHDVLYTYKLFNLLKDQMIDYKSIFKLELNLVPIVAQMNLAGITIDSDKLRSMAEKAHVELDKRFGAMQMAFNEKTAAARKFFSENNGVPYPPNSPLIGEKGVKPLNSYYNEEFNPNSPYQVRAILIEGFQMPILKRTDTSQISTDAEVLEQYAEMGCDFAKQLMEYRTLSKYITNYLDKIPEICSHTDKLYASFNQMGADSGRFSCPSSANWQDVDRTVNLQNQPQDDGTYNIRTCYVSPPGYTWVKADYKQQEYRAMCNIAGEKEAIQKFKDGVDFHSMMARNMLGIPEDQEVTKEQRKLGKCVTGDTLIYSPSHGLIPIKDVSDFRVEDAFEPLDMTVVDMHGKLVKAASFYYGGKRRVTNIVTRYGYKLGGSSDKHRIIVLGANGLPEYKKVSDITTDDYVVIKLGGSDFCRKSYVPLYSDPSWKYSFSYVGVPTEKDKDILKALESCYGIRQQVAESLGVPVSRVESVAKKYCVPRPLKGRPHEFVIDTVTEDVAELWGLVLADGYITKKGHVTFGSADRENIDRFIELSKRIWPSYTPKVYYKPTRNGVGFWNVAIFSRFVGDQFSHGNLGRKGADLEFPLEILQSSSSVQKAFLVGWWNGDGCFTNRAIKTSSISNKFITGMHQLLLSLGIISRVWSETSNLMKGTGYLAWNLQVIGLGSAEKFYDCIYTGLIHRKQKKFDEYVSRLTVHGSPLCVMYNLASLVKKCMPGLSSEQKKNMYRHINGGVNSYGFATIRDLCASGCLDPYEQDFLQGVLDREYMAVPVVDIIETEEDVFDIFVPEGNQFVAGGFVNHNTLNFGVSYGMGVPTIAKDIGRTIGEAQALYDAYFQSLPNLKALIQWARKQVEETEMIKTYFGRVRKLEWKDQPSRRADMIKNSGFNTMIQGTAADITKIAMLRVKDRVLDKYPKELVQMLLQVHDELDFIVRNDHLDEICAVIKNAMTIPTPDEWVDFEVDLEIGPSWSELDHKDWEGEFKLDPFNGWGELIPVRYQSYLTVPGYSATWR